MDFLRTIKVCSTTFFRGEVKPSDAYSKMLRHIKKYYEVRKRYFIGKVQRPFLANFLLFCY
jgi:hypothetical protein